MHKIDVFFSFFGVFFSFFRQNFLAKDGKKSTIGFIMANENTNLLLFGLKDGQRSIRGAYIFLFAYVFATVLGAIFAPLAFWFAQYLHETNPGNETLTWLAGKGVDIFFDRARYVAIVLALPVVFIKCRLTSLGALRMKLNLKALKEFAKYYLLGLFLLAAMYAMQLLFTSCEIKGISSGKFCEVLGVAFVSTLLLAFLEELLFRDLIMRSFYTAWGMFLGIVLSSLFFAYKHFKVPSGIGGVDLHSASWYTGFQVAWYDTVGIFMSFDAFSFISLFMFGCVLCTMFLRAKTLYAPIGFHSAAVLAIMLYEKFVVPESSDSLRIVFGGVWVTKSYAALIFLTLLLVFLLFSRQKNSPESLKK